MVTQERVRIASRGSQLALWQAETIRDRLLEIQPGLSIEIEVVRTTGDRILDVPLAKIGDRGLFTKEIDEAILEGRAELAVHSLKDVPTRVPEGLELSAICERADPRDVLVGPESNSVPLADLPAGSRIGTSSLRRRSQLRHLRSDLDVVDLRGNLNTRLEKLDRGEYDAIILAAAGVTRLGWSTRITEYLDPPEWLPAVGQGALAVISRQEDTRVTKLLRPLHHQDTATCVTAEREFLRQLEGGCQVPIGALATLHGESLTLHGLVADLEGTRILRDEAKASPGDPAGLGASLAQALLRRGAADILAQIRDQSPAPGIPGP